MWSWSLSGRRGVRGVRGYEWEQKEGGGNRGGLTDSSIVTQRSLEREKEKEREGNGEREREGRAGRLPNLIGPGGDSKRLWVSWRHAALAVGEL